MGLLDAFMPGETGGMPNGNGFLNFLQTPQGQALASGIASYAAGARQNTPINNIGRGLLGGVSGYGDAIKSRQEAERQAQTIAYNKKQQELLGIHYDTERMRAEAARKAAEQRRAETEGFNKFMLPGFQKAVGYQIPVQGFDEEGNPVFGDSEGQIIPAAFEQQGGFLSTLDPDMREMIGAQMEDPSMRKQASAQLFKLYADSKRWNKTEKSPTIGFDDAMDSIAAGVPVKGFEAYTPEYANKVIAARQARGKERAAAGAMKLELPGQKEVAKDLAGPVGQRAEASLSMAEGAVETMTNANMVRDSLNKGLVIAGPMAGVRMKWAQLKNLAGYGDTAQLEATRTTIQGLAALTLDSRASLKGQGQITEGETKLLERARSGNIEDMTVEELQTVIDVSQRLAGRQWSNHQHLLSIMKADPAAQASIRYYYPRAQLPSPIGKGGAGKQPPNPAVRPVAPTGKSVDDLVKKYGGK